MNLLRGALVIVLVTVLLSASLCAGIPRTSALALGDRTVIRITDYQPRTAEVGQPATLAAKISREWYSGNTLTGTFPAVGCQVKITEEHDTSTYTGVVASNGWAICMTGYDFKMAGSHRIHIRADDSVQDDAGTTITAWTEGDRTVIVSGGSGSQPQQSTPAPQQSTPTAQPSAKQSTPLPTVPPGQQQSTPQSGSEPALPPDEVINQLFPGGTIERGTSKFGDPQVTVTQPGPDKLRTTLIDFAANPEANTDHYNQQVETAKAEGWKLSAQGETTYTDHNKDYRYSRFVKGSNALFISAQGPNSADKLYDVPTNSSILITSTEETFATDTGFALFGLSGLAAWTALAAVGIVIIGIIGAVFYFRRREQEEGK